MTPQRWREIEELYHAVLEEEPTAREALLEGADPDLRREVESLLEQSSSLPNLEVETETLTQATQVSQLGPYRIEGVLGAGGMGQVFRASDTRLHRTVAIKILPHDKVADPDRKRRFLQEARAASALNHPNIITVHDIASDNGIDYLVMEYLPGKSLDKLIASKGLPLADVFSCAMQIASALAAAHAAGIVHRDIKPANIIVTVEGQVKVLDFGLAKLEGRFGPDRETQTIEPTLTESGMVMGTAAYMSPEQARAEAVDARTDLFSLGAVLYEMATGRRAFPRALDWRTPSTDVLPPELEGVVLKLLDTDRELRYQTAADVLADLKRFQRPAKARRWSIAAAAAAALALTAVGYFYLHRVPKLTDKDTIVLADFDNKTGDPVFDDTLRQGLSVELQQSPFLSLIPDTQIQRTLVLMGQPKDARLTPEIAQQVCERTASAAVLDGSIASLGSQYVLGLRAKNCNTGTSLDQEQIQAARKEDVLNSLSQVARKFRTRVGESLATVEMHSTPLAEATTPSLEALKAYSTAVKVNLSSGNAAAIPLMRRAVEIDPRFAMAYATLGLNYSNVGESVLAAGSSTKAWQLRDRASDREKFFIEFNYDRQATGNLERAFQTLELWAQTYPRSVEPNPQGLLGGLSAMGTGRFERSIEQGKKTIAAEPDDVFGYTSVAQGNFYLDRFAEAENAVQQLSARKLEVPDFLIYEYNLAFLKGNKEQMDRVMARANGKPRAEDLVANSEALVLARSGRLQLARRSSGRAVHLARQAGQREAEATYHAVRAVWEAFYGNATEARRNVMEALALSNGRDVKYAAALALAVAGDFTQSQALGADLEKHFPEDTFVQFTYVPVLRALSALHRGQPIESVERLQIALRYELAVNGLTFRLYMGGLHSAYVRGEALAATRQYTEAIAEFQKILDHRGIVGADPIGALARLQLGRVFALSGDKTKAKASYQDFLALWKDADRDVPILIEARKEYAALN